MLLRQIYIFAAIFLFYGVAVLAEQSNGDMMHGHKQAADGSLIHDEINMPMLYGENTSQLEVDEMKALFLKHKDIHRSVELISNGIKTRTETDNDALREFLVGHAVGMMQRVEDGNDPRVPIQSPTLTPLFQLGDKVTTEVELTKLGIMVIQTSNDPTVVAALQKHALEVSDLAGRGMMAVHEQLMGLQHKNWFERGLTAEIKFGSLIARQILKAPAEGQLSDLAGEGKPLPDRSAMAMTDMATYAAVRIMEQARALPEEFKIKKLLEDAKSTSRQAEGVDEKQLALALIAELAQRYNIVKEACIRFMKP